MDPENVNTVEQITQMEDALREALNRIQMQKKCFGNELMPLDCAGEFHNGMHLPMNMTTNEQLPSNIQWIQDGDDRTFMFSGIPGFLPQRNYMYSTETSLQDYHGYFIDEKQAVCNKHGQDESLNDPSQNSCLQLQLGAQHPYNSYGMNFLGEKKFQTNGEVSLQADHVDFQVNGFDPARHGFDAELQTWATTGSCGVSMFDGHPYTQQPKQT
uniref:MADS-box protein-like protein n=1 Tax=Cymbidium goeringii TaxID=112607 RepID=A0A455LA75_9ASPA|nr:MADS-box protein-like protein [Cymbidium goeringii]